MDNSTLVAISILALASVGPTQAQAGGNSNDQQGQNNNGQNGNDEHQKKHTAAPEIDPAGAITALTLLAGGLAAVRGRRKSG